MHRLVFATTLAAFAAVYASSKPDMLAHLVQTKSPASAAAQDNSATVEPVKVSAPCEVSIPAGSGGHFLASFRINGREVQGLVDTGATFVALNEETARQVGVSRSDLDYRYAVTTANGTTQAAHITINRMDIGQVTVRDVDAFVLKDKSLSGTLVGMSFMSRLKSYKVQDGVLYLKN